MRRGDRLFEIIQVLRRASAPLTADAIASELETSKRTIYRDISALMARRVPIRGEAGIGYVLDRGFDLPPLMLTTDEAEAVALGCQWVIAHADASLARAALDVLAKVAAIVPDDLRQVIEDPAVGTPPARAEVDDGIDIAELRLACRQGSKLSLSYRDGTDRDTERVVWPFMVGYVEGVRVVMAWCELRQGFRIFRTDRMAAAIVLDARYPDHPVALRRRWLAEFRATRRSEEDRQ